MPGHQTKTAAPLPLKLPLWDSTITLYLVKSRPQNHVSKTPNKRTHGMGNKQKCLLAVAMSSTTTLLAIFRAALQSTIIYKTTSGPLNHL